MAGALSWLREELTSWSDLKPQYLSLRTICTGQLNCVYNTKQSDFWTEEHRSEFEEEMASLWKDKFYFPPLYLLLKHLNFFTWGHDLSIVNLSISSFICFLSKLSVITVLVEAIEWSPQSSFLSSLTCPQGNFENLLIQRWLIDLTCLGYTVEAVFSF